MTDESHLIERLRGGAMCVYLSCGKDQADAISKLLTQAADALSARSESAHQTVSPGTATPEYAGLDGTFAPLSASAPKREGEVPGGFEELFRTSLEQEAARSSSREPVLWRYRYKDGPWKYVEKFEDVNPLPHYNSEPLYATPVSATATKEQSDIDFFEAARDHKDAERYRWLAQQGCKCDGTQESCYLDLNPLDLDLAIDCALDRTGA